MGGGLLWHSGCGGLEEELNNFSLLSFLNFSLNLVLILNDLIIGIMELYGNNFTMELGLFHSG